MKRKRLNRDKPDGEYLYWEYDKSGKVAVAGKEIIKYILY